MATRTSRSLTTSVSTYMLPRVSQLAHIDIQVARAPSNFKDEEWISLCGSHWTTVTIALFTFPLISSVMFLLIPNDPMNPVSFAARISFVVVFTSTFVAFSVTNKRFLLLGVLISLGLTLLLYLVVFPLAHVTWNQLYLYFSLIITMAVFIPLASHYSIPSADETQTDENPHTCFTVTCTIFGFATAFGQFGFCMVLGWWLKLAGTLRYGGVFQVFLCGIYPFIILAFKTIACAIVPEEYATAVDFSFSSFAAVPFRLVFVSVKAYFFPVLILFVEFLFKIIVYDVLLRPQFVCMCHGLGKVVDHFDEQYGVRLYLLNEHRAVSRVLWLTTVEEEHSHPPERYEDALQLLHAKFHLHQLLDASHLLNVLMIQICLRYLPFSYLDGTVMRKLPVAAWNRLAALSAVSFVVEFSVWWGFPMFVPWMALFDDKYIPNKTEVFLLVIGSSVALILSIFVMIDPTATVYSPFE